MQMRTWPTIFQNIFFSVETGLQAFQELLYHDNIQESVLSNHSLFLCNYTGSFLTQKYYKKLNVLYLHSTCNSVEKATFLIAQRNTFILFYRALINFPKYTQLRLEMEKNNYLLFLEVMVIKNSDVTVTMWQKKKTTSGGEI